MLIFSNLDRLKLSFLFHRLLQLILLLIALSNLNIFSLISPWLLENRDQSYLFSLNLLLNFPSSLDLQPYNLLLFILLTLISQFGRSPMTNLNRLDLPGLIIQLLQLFLQTLVVLIIQIQHIKLRLLKLQINLSVKMVTLKQSPNHHNTQVTYHPTCNNSTTYYLCTHRLKQVQISTVVQKTNTNSYQSNLVTHVHYITQSLLVRTNNQQKQEHHY